MRKMTMWIRPLAGLLVLTAVGAPGPLAAQVPAAEQQLRAVQACRAIADAAQRVACYDRASAPTEPGAAGASRAPVPPPPSPPTPEERFGRAAESARPAPPPPPQRPEQASAQRLDEITAKIVSLRADALGRISFALDNGQVWRMTESEGVFDFPNRGDTVTIRRGAIGGYRLDWGTNVGVRVARQD